MNWACNRPRREPGADLRIAELPSAAALLADGEHQVVLGGRRRRYRASRAAPARRLAGVGAARAAGSRAQHRGRGGAAGHGAACHGGPLGRGAFARHVRGGNLSQERGVGRVNPRLTGVSAERH